MSARLVSLGEVMLRMSPPRFQRLRSARAFDIHVAGAQLNVAADFARLGGEGVFVSKLPANELGTLAYDACLSYGVDMRHVQRVEGARMGVNYLEFSPSPRAPIAIFDRKGSAASTMRAEDFAWREVVANAQVAHTDGIVPGLSEGCHDATLAFLRAAREMGVKTSFDVNYRDHLWTAAAAKACWSTLLPLIDVVVTNRGVSEAVFGYTGSDEDILFAYQRDFGCELVCLTHREMYGLERGAWSSKALRDGAIVEGRRFAFEIIDRYGTGDAFLAGLVYAYLEHDAAYALSFGNATCALAHTTEGDVISFTAAEVLPLLSDQIDLRVKR